MIPGVNRVLAIIGFLVVGVVAGGCFDSGDSDRDSSSPALADTVTHPSTERREERIIENLEWNWVERPACEIEGCWQLELVAPPGGCPNGVYGELWILDENETVIDSSIDKLPPLAAGQRGRLEFNYLGDEPDVTERLIKLNCHVSHP
jgi:hypothetical protein